MADAKIKEVITGIAGSHIKSFNSHGMVAIKDKEVAQYDIGGRQTGINDKGERYFLDDSQISQGKARAQASVGEWCK